MKKLIILSLGLAGVCLLAGCEDEHKNRGPYGGTYEGSDHFFGQEMWPGYPRSDGYWDRSDDWHPH